MNFLALCRQVSQLVGVGSGVPATVVSQTKQMAMVVDAVREAWVEIQDLHTNWEFLWSEFEVNHLETSLGSGVWSKQMDLRDALVFPGGLVKGVEETDFTIFKTASGSTTMERLKYDPDYREFRYRYRLVTDLGQPTRIALRPDNKLEFNYQPDTFYTIGFTGWTDPIQLAADVDTPACKADYHMIIAYKAAMKLSGHFEADFPYATWDREYKELLYLLERHSLPQATVYFRPVA